MPPGDTKAVERPRPGESGERPTRAEELLGLFAWHKDAPLVARALRLTLDELHAELDALGIRRKAFRLARTAPGDVPRARPLPGVAAGPPVRRRIRPHPAAEVVEPPEPVAEQSPPRPSGAAE